MPFLKDGEIRRRAGRSKEILEMNNNKLNTTLTDSEEMVIDTEESTDGISWKDGRRIVELFSLAKALNSCQNVNCTAQLNLLNVEKEKLQGFGSYLTIRCLNCNMLNNILTNKTHYGTKGPAIFDINTKAAIGMIEAGIGPRQLNKFVTALGIPGATAKTLKKREREIQKPLSEIAKTSCVNALQEEIEKTREQLNVETTNGTDIPKLTAKYDMCWQKRGSGRSYSSHSGVGSVIGQNTGKVLNFKVCSDHCRICLKASQLGKEPENHECQKNWNKSPKAMEAHTGAELLKILEDIGGTQVGVLVMDDDSATLSQVKERLGHPVEKWSDINHSRKSVGNSMYNTLQKKHKTLTTTVIKYFQKCFSYAISQNKNQENALKETLISIVPHAFGHHEKCGNWCKADNDNFSFKSLPGGKALSGDDLYNDLYIVFETMSNNSHKLAPGGSTKDVESLNGIFASKAPKRICYSASESLKNRVSATVAQKNIGYHYISELHLEAGLSPNKITKKQSECLSKERKRQLIYNQQPEVKKRKIKTNNEKKTEIAKKEKVEGTTYKSDVAFSLVTEINNIPGIRYRPNIETVTNFDGNFAVFDLETSSLQEDCEILQIACKFNDNEFSCYIQPTKPISKMSSAVTGLTNEGGVLFHHGKPIRAINREAAFQNFVIWLSQYKPVILIGHNAKFDPKRGVEQLRACGVLETIRISAAGYPSRWTYSEFFQRYRVLARSKDIDRANPRKTCQNILISIIQDPDKYRFGKTKIFFRAGQVAYLEKLRSDKLRSCGIMIQKHVKGWLERKRYRKITKSITLLQKYGRGLLARRYARHLRETWAAKTIQKRWKGYKARSHYEHVRNAVLILQASIRGFFGRREFEKALHTHRAVVIQRYARGWLARVRYRRVIRGIIKLQGHYRRRKAKKELQKLKIEAKSVDHIKNVNKGLENKIIQLQQQLDVRKQEMNAVKQQEGEMDKMKVELEKLRGSSGQVEKSSNKITELLAEIKALKIELEKEQIEKQDLIAEKEIMRKDKVEIANKLTEENNKLSADLELAKTQLDEQEKELADMVKAKVEAAKKQLLSELDSEREHHQKLVKEHARLQQRLENLHGEMEYLTSPQGHKRTPSDISAISLESYTSSVSPDEKKEEEENEKEDQGYGTEKSKKKKKAPAPPLPVNGETKDIDVGLLLKLQNRVKDLEKEKAEMQKEIDTSEEQEQKPTSSSDVITDSAFNALKKQLVNADDVQLVIKLQKRVKDLELTKSRLRSELDDRDDDDDELTKFQITTPEFAYNNLKMQELENENDKLKREVGKLMKAITDSTDFTQQEVSPSGKELMDQFEAMNDELERRREECLQLRAMMAEKSITTHAIAKESYGGNDNIVNEDNELAMAYRTQKELNRYGDRRKLYLINTIKSSVSLFLQSSLFQRFYFRNLLF
ncbi:myosin V [Mytilus galloprovincialis]|uniref:Myosin V n=2 Tax=Mytilus galloprovincialis TaxID=29158 RepID=A0A8B6GUG8_MYTGA|nr:myosin V [Mytilus galloprovincialis]